MNLSEHQKWLSVFFFLCECIPSSLTCRAQQRDPVSSYSVPASMRKHARLPARTLKHARTNMLLSDRALPSQWSALLSDAIARDSIQLLHSFFLVFSPILMSPALRVPAIPFTYRQLRPGQHCNTPFPLFSGKVNSCVWKWACK